MEYIGHKSATHCCRSREGAWIEIFKSVLMMCDFSVAPVRERGLKSHCRISPLLNLSRSREGARIEILVTILSSKRV